MLFPKASSMSHVGVLCVPCAVDTDFDSTSLTDCELFIIVIEFMNCKNCQSQICYNIAIRKMKFSVKKLFGCNIQCKINNEISPFINEGLKRGTYLLQYKI